MRFLGIDIGGTTINTVILDEDEKTIASTEAKSNPVSEQAMFNAVVESIEAVLKQAGLKAHDIDGAGIGVPGKVDREKGIAVYQNNLPWRDFPLSENIKKQFSFDNIVVENDVHMAAFGEWRAANAKPQTTFVYITISTGISCAIINSGSFINGLGFAGEIGSLPVMGFSETNRLATIENTVSGKAIEQLARKKFKDPDMSTQDFFKEYDHGNLQAHELMKDVVSTWGYGIYSVICLLDPHDIVLGGGVVNNNPYVLDLLKKEVKQYIATGQNDTLDNLTLSKLNQNSGVIGAALTAMEKFETNKQALS